ncbi:hypothetical protein Tco_0872635 [Tanacetum coccineum]
MRIIRDNLSLNLTVYDRFVLKILGFSEWLEVHALASKWVKTQAGKLGIPPPPQLTTFGLTASELIKEVFMKEDIVMDRMHRNLVPPLGVVPSEGLVICEPESGIFFYNINFDLVFQRENKFHLATTPQLIRIQNAIKVDSKLAECKASASNEGLAECKALTSNLRRIQVKDIVKKVKDYLNTYSSAGMDISWYVEGIR